MSLQRIVSHDMKLITDHIQGEIKSMLETSPIGKPIYFIVPEQMTFQEEYNLLNDEQLKGSIRAQVVSFSRLAWRVLQERGGSTKQFISSTGIQMLLRKIVEQRTEPFLMFEKARDKAGFMKELDQLITEFKRHRVSPEQIEAHLEQFQEEGSLYYKLTDLHYIYEGLVRQLQGQYIDGEDQLELLIEHVKEANILKDAQIFIAGFHRFTPQELAIVAELLQVADQVTIGLNLAKSSLETPLDELDLFYQTKETYLTLGKLASDIQLPVKETLFLEGDSLRQEPFIHLQNYFDERPTPTYPKDLSQQIKLAEAVHPRAEVEAVIQDMLSRVRDHQYRYRDMAIFVRETDQYYDLIQTLFADYGIPVFIDEKKTMLNHPLIEFIRSLFDVIESNWRYDAMFRLIKTGFIPLGDEGEPLDEDAIDQLENYVLAYGIRHEQQWTKDEDWIYRRFQGFTEAVQTDQELAFEQKINRHRRQIVSVLAPFFRDFLSCRTVLEKTERLYSFLEGLHIVEQLEAKRKNYESLGQLERAREEEQVWQAVVQLFDELVEMIGEESMSFADYRAVVESGLEALEFSHVPPSMDHVIVGTIDHSRISGKQCVYLIGVNEGAWPMKPKVDGVINEKERERLEAFGFELAASNRRSLLDDHFYMYLAFTSASEYLWVSYVLSDHEGKSKIPSQMINRLLEFFPSLARDKVFLTDPEEAVDTTRFITTKEKTRGPLIIQLSRYLRGYAIEEDWWQVLNWYIEHEAKHDSTHRSLQSLFYKNKAVPLKARTVAKLMDDRVKLSVSRIEMLHRCSYQHFLNYSLQLKERQTYSLEAPDIGELFHEAIKAITEEINREGKDFKDLSKEDSAQYAARSLKKFDHVLQHHVLSSSNRYRYIKQKLERVIAQATYILSEQARASGFSPIGIELPFGYEKGLEAIKIPLANQREIWLRGRIDRVDKAEDDQHLYLRIIDYKSSKQQLSLEEVYYGLALQMLTYLHVVLLQSEKWLGKQAKAAGVLYFHVHDALLRNADRLSENDIEDELFKQYKMNGLLLKDADVAILMDEALASGKSDIVPAALKKDGDFAKYSKVQDEASFMTIRSYIEWLMKRAGLYMYSGKVDINPYESKDRTACRFCPYQSICQFDPILEENKYRQLPPLSDDEVIKRMEKMLKA